MHDQNMWKLFEQTGTINDYLNYKNCEKDKEESTKKTGESSYETRYHGNGNDTIGSTCG